ncbi:hypothetical protein V5T82_14145 [Magnetovibrio sp. PR-2]|uniref:hypothetical protein n=1 Tax=Magnetovibrio sp. PR-2 TaxID=3120356 RepID=UPI002FCDE977
MTINIMEAAGETIKHMFNAMDDVQIERDGTVHEHKLEEGDYTIICEGAVFVNHTVVSMMFIGSLPDKTQCAATLLSQQLHQPHELTTLDSSPSITIIKGNEQQWNDMLMNVKLKVI